MSDTGEMPSADGALVEDVAVPPPATYDVPPAPRNRGRWLKIGLIGLLALALVAAGTVVAVAKWHKHQRAVARERAQAQRIAYVDGVRAIDRRIAQHIAPTQHIMVLASTPRPGDIFAIRDAVSGSEAIEALRGDEQTLSALKVPTGWADNADALSRALQGMRDALVAMRAERDVRNAQKLNEDLLATANFSLVGAVGIWQQAVADLFAKVRQSPPDAVASAATSRIAPSMTGWVFAADRACIRFNLEVIRLDPRLTEGSIADPAIYRSVAGSMDTLAEAIRSVPLPASGAQAIRRDIIARLRSVDAMARTMERVASAIERRDSQSLSEAVDQMRTTAAALEVLSTQLRRLHVIGCAAAMGGEAPQHTGETKAA